MKRILLLCVLGICSLICILPVAAVDTTPPGVFSTDPADEAVKVAIDIDAITITFSEPIQYLPESWKQVTFKTYGGGSYPDYPMGAISASGNVLTIAAPSSPEPWFLNWDFYYVTVAGVYDLANNEMEVDGYNYYQFHFQTVSTDVTLPSVVSTYPANGDSNIPADVTITALMSELINQCSGTVEMVDHDNNLIALEEGGKTGTHYYTDDYLNLEIFPSNPLVLGETYTVTISGIHDSYLNEMDPYSWSFTVQTPIEDLSTRVDELGLPPDVEDGLMAKLAAAQLQIDQMKYKPAQKMLMAFIKQVESQAGKTISTADAEELIAIAQQIFDSIS